MPFSFSLNIFQFWAIVSHFRRWITSNFRPCFPHFRLSAHFPFYTCRPPDSYLVKRPFQHPHVPLFAEKVTYSGVSQNGGFQKRGLADVPPVPKRFNGVSQKGVLRTVSPRFLFCFAENETEKNGRKVEKNGRKTEKETETKRKKTEKRTKSEPFKTAKTASKKQQTKKRNGHFGHNVEEEQVPGAERARGQKKGQQMRTCRQSCVDSFNFFLDYFLTFLSVQDPFH